MRQVGEYDSVYVENVFKEITRLGLQICGLTIFDKPLKLPIILI
jgi:hypothetical protein